MIELVAADIGGTHARFALAAIEAGRVVRLDPPVTLRAADFAGLADAWQAFAAQVGRPLPRAAGIAVAAPPGDIYKFTNSDWVVRPASLACEIGVDAFTLINDFGAVGHAVARLEPANFQHFCGPNMPLPDAGLISIIGPGTGLGVAQLLRRDGHYHVIETEGGHIEFGPLDALEDRIAKLLRARHGRVSIERLVSGSGLAVICEALAERDGTVLPPRDNKALWIAAQAGDDPLPAQAGDDPLPAQAGDDPLPAQAGDDALLAQALDCFCRIWGSVTGDLALAHGANAVVLAGGIGQRLSGRLASSGFTERFVAKGRYASRMAALPVKLITHPEPGLYGAAAAFAEQHPA
jgi:glucokinase